MKKNVLMALAVSFLLLTGFGPCNPELDKVLLAQTCVWKHTDTIVYFDGFNQELGDPQVGCATIGSAVTDGTLDPVSLFVDTAEPFTYFLRTSASASSLDLIAMNYPGARDAYALIASSEYSFVVPAILPEDVLDADKVVNFRIKRSSPDFPDAVSLTREWFVRLLDDDDNEVAFLYQTTDPNAGTVQVTLKVGRTYRIEANTTADFLSLGGPTASGTEPVLIQSLQIEPWVQAAVAP